MGFEVRCEQRCISKEERLEKSQILLSGEMSQFEIKGVSGGGRQEPDANQEE